MAFPKKVEIDRSKWINNHTENVLGLPKLLDPNTGGMCCLGFVARACGAVNADIIGISEPCEVDMYLEKLNIKEVEHEDGYGPEEVSMNTDLTDSAMGANDAWDVTKQEREDNLADLFREHGCELVFTGEYPDGTKDDQIDD